MNKKNLTKGIVAAALVGVIAVGSTFAYLSATTGTKTNNFTSDNKNVNGSTEETFDKNTAENYMPGDSIFKKPFVSLSGDSEDARVALSVDYYGLDVQHGQDGSVTTGTKLSQEQFKKYATVEGFDLDNWTSIAKSTNGSELYMRTAVLNETSEPALSEDHKEPNFPLFTGIKVNAGLKTITTEEIKTTNVFDSNGDLVSNATEVLGKEDKTAYVDANGNILSLSALPKFTIEIKGFAVQAKNIEAPKSEEELIKLANVGREEADLFKAELK